MHAVLLTVHGLVVLALIVIVLLQRSEGGALGMGGGGGGGFMTSRGAANVLTRTTSVLAALFFATSIALALTARSSARDTDIAEQLTGERVIDPTKPLTTDDLLNTLGTGSASATTAPSLEATPIVPDSAPATETPAAGAPDASADMPETAPQPN